MGKLNALLFRYLTYEDFAVLAGVEWGMRNHELVAAPLAASLSNLKSVGVHRILRELCQNRLLCYERGKKFDGYRLTNLGYDYLALHNLIERNIIASFGNQIGVGKESNIYIVANEDGEEFCLKLHRLGRVCFRKVKEKRDYHKHAKSLSWLYLSKVSATKEFSYMTALHDEGFPIPKPIGVNRHCVVMELVEGELLNNITEVEDAESLYEQLMDIIVRFASCGLIHGDFNEFNIMISEEEKPIIIDFPQMMSTEHVDAEEYFNRDVECIKTFFRKRFGYESELYPKFEDIKRTGCLDGKVRCTGFSRATAKRWNIELESEEIDENGDCCEENDQKTDSGEEDRIVESNSTIEQVEDKSSDYKGEENHNKIKEKENYNNDSNKKHLAIESWLSNLDLNYSHKETGDETDSDSSSNCGPNEDQEHSVTPKFITHEERTKRKIKREVQRKKEKEERKRLRVKGEASAVRRGRKRNMDHVKQTKFLFDI